MHGLRLTASAFASIGRRDLARRALERILDLDQPLDVQLSTLLSIGRLHLEDGDSREAGAAFARCLEEHAKRGAGVPSLAADVAAACALERLAAPLDALRAKIGRERCAAIEPTWAAILPRLREVIALEEPRAAVTAYAAIAEVERLLSERGCAPARRRAAAAEALERARVITRAMAVDGEPAQRLAEELHAFDLEQPIERAGRAHPIEPPIVSNGLDDGGPLDARRRRRDAPKRAPN